MNKTHEERVSSQNPQYAAMDRQRKNKENAKLFSVEDQAAALAFAKTVDHAYFRKNTYLNFNENNITVKVNRPKQVDKLDPRVKDFESTLDDHDIEVKDLPNGNRLYVLPFEPA